jgi:hypothetical protein
MEHHDSESVEPFAYCREIEAYLCRKNDGHLIRIVGPSFERVSTWAERGVPLKVAFRGIDRCFERYYARGPRRRPVRIDFCEADVLDVFDEWRRAVGIAGLGTGRAGPGDAADQPPAGEDEATGRGRTRTSLPVHLDRVIARLTQLLAGGQPPPELFAALDRLARELDQARADARSSRGEARAALIARLAALDRDMIDAAHRSSPLDLLALLRDEAEAEMAPFRSRMPREAYVRALDATLDHLLRVRLGLPVVAYD